MTHKNIHITNPDNSIREIDWIELNRLKKDILWIYDENIGQINSCFAPAYSFKSKYWEYLTLDGDYTFSEEDKGFYKNGVLVILLCFCVEYNSLASGDQQVFKRTELPIALKYITDYEAQNNSEIDIKNKIILGLKMAMSTSESELMNTDFEHKDLDEFYNNLNAIGNVFIHKYYKSILNEL